MSERPTPEATLKRLVRDARAEEPADVDFARVEQRLLKSLARPTAERPKTSYGWVWVAFAAAACAALWLVKAQTSSTAPSAPTAQVATEESLERDGDALGVGVRVRAGEHPIAVVHAGRATWRLASQSSALLAEKGERITVQLERGSVLSEVVRSPRPETFVVEAGGTRVAVHGTVFRVSLEGGRVDVRVSEGVVAVGPRGSAPAFLLRAPAHGDFASDGLSGTIDGKPAGAPASRASEPFKPGRLRAAPSPSALPSAAPPLPIAELPREPSINDIESGIAHSVDVASGCFTQHTQSADGVQVTVRTALSLRITGAGQAVEVQFQPPLSPDVESCARAGISNLAFAPSEQGAQVTRMLELKH